MSDSSKMSFRLSPTLQAALAARVRPGHSMSDIIREALEAFVGIRPTQADVSDTVPDTSDILSALMSDMSDLRQRVEHLEAQRVIPTSPSVRQRPTRPPAQPGHRRPGRPSSLRPLIIALLQSHPEGLTAVQIKVLLGIEKNVGDTLSGMVRNGVIDKTGTRPAVRYVAVQP